MRIISIILAALTALLAVAACGPGTPADSRPLVVCTIFSYYDAARAIAGDKCRVEILLPPGQSPHDYQSNAQNKAEVYAAKLYIKNGMGLDDRFDGLVGGDTAKVLTIGAAVKTDDILKTEEVPLNEKPGEEEDHSAGNPHIWLDPHIQMAAAEQIRDRLCAMAPADAGVFKANADKYLADLKKLDEDFAAAAAKFKTREFIGFHSAYDYLAHRYGLRQIASIEEIPGSGLTVAQTEKIVKLIQDKNIKYIALENAFPSSGIDKIVQRTGVKTIILQPLETYDNTSDTYVKLMRDNLDALKTALD